MSDLLERELAARLDAVAATVPDELEPPASLEFEVAVRRRRARTHSRRTRVMALAAAIAVVAGSAAVIHTERSRSRVHVVAPPASDPLIAGTAMLGVHGRDVVALDRSGHLLATIVHAQRGAIVDAQITRDHSALWYLSVAGRAGVDCGEVVRADLRTGVSKIMAHALLFAISPDARRLALYGEGHVASGACEPKARPAVATIDLWSETRAYAPSIDHIRTLVWSDDGSTLIARRCRAARCDLPMLSIDAADAAWFTTRIATRAIAAHGTELLTINRSGHELDGLTLGASGSASRRVVLQTKATLTRVFVTPVGVFVVAGTQLARIDNSHLLVVGAAPAGVTGIRTWSGG